MDAIYSNVLEGDAEGVVKAVDHALKAGVEPNVIINESLISAMAEVGSRMKRGDMFVPEVLASARAMKEGLKLLKPLLGGKTFTRGKIIIGTVVGDLHDIGKNLVAMLLESAGFDVVDLGIDTPTEKFLAAIEAHKPDIVGLSALLTTTMAAMKSTVGAIHAQYPSVRIMVGGAPVSQEFAESIKAHGYAPDAAAAADLATRLIN